MAKKKKKVEEEVINEEKADKEEEEIEEEETEEEEEESEEETEKSEDDEDEDDDDSEDEDEDDDDSDDDEDDDSDDDEDDDSDEDEDESEEVVKKESSQISDKSRYIIIAVVSVLLIGLIAVLVIVDKDKKKTDDNKTEERVANTDTLKEFYKQFDSKDLSVIFFASSTCGYCSLEKPILANISEDYKMNHYDIDASKLSEDELKEIIKALGIQGATPTTVIVKGGKVVASNEGYLDGKQYVEFFVKNGVLKEGSTYKEESKLKEVTYDEFKKVAKSKKRTLVLLDSSACQNCITVRSMLNEYAEKNDFEINYLFAGSLSEDNVKNLIEVDLKKMGYSEKTYKKDGTVNIPLLLVIKDNKIKDYVVTSVEKSDYTKVLKKYGYIK